MVHHYAVATTFGCKIQKDSLSWLSGLIQNDEVIFRLCVVRGEGYISPCVCGQSHQEDGSMLQCMHFQMHERAQ